MHYACMYKRPAQLRDNPLLRSRLVVDACQHGADTADRIEVLCTMLADAAGTLDASPRERKLFKAVEKTYLKPAPSQELAAEQLGVPYSSFRRHLTVGVEAIAEALWHKEVG